MNDARIEVERSLAPRRERGVHIACEDLQPARRFVVYPGRERYPITQGVEAISLGAIRQLVAST